MLYKLFLYKPDPSFRDELAINNINIAVSKNTLKDWYHNCAENYMLNYDFEKVKSEIENMTGTESDTPVCKVYINNTPEHKARYITIATSYENAKNVLLSAHNIAFNNGLVLYDDTLNRCFSPDDLYDDKTVFFRTRAKQINKVILDTQKPVWHLRRLCNDDLKCYKSRAYVLTLRKDKEKTFEQRTKEFYECLQGCLLEGETLVTEDRYFKIIFDFCEIIYCLEAYKKHSNMIGYVENGTVKTDLLHRMSCEKAFKWQKNYTPDVESWCDPADIKARMYFNEMISAYKNPADRFVKSINIEKQQQKEPFEIRYSSTGYYGSEIIFQPVIFDGQENNNAISVLKIEEDSATFILPIIYEIYPYFYNRYYLTKNYIPCEEMLEIISKLKEVKDIIINDTYNKSLEKYTKKFFLYVLARENKPGGLYINEDIHLFEIDRTRFIYNNRYKIAHLYDLFIKWVETQLEEYESYDNLMFNIQGP